jgi:two-component system, cell cycle sensor histidine kinase and response regulator CckA
VSCADLSNSEAAAPKFLTTTELVSVEKQVILLVEDEPLVRKVTCEVLQSAGYRVLKAKNSAEAVRTFLQHGEEVNLLLTDVIMPGRNGHELARELRAICPSLKIVFTSGFPENTVTSHGLHEAGLFYLPKPYAVQSLIAKVRHALEEEVLQEPMPRVARRAAGNG